MAETTSAPATTGARTLTEALRRFDEDALVRLLRLRPDLAYPVPSDVADLSAQMATTASVARALDDLNTWLRLVAEGLAALPDPATLAELTELLHAEPAADRAAEPADCVDPVGAADSANVTSSADAADPGVTPAAVAAAIAELRSRALLWGGDDELHLVRTARDLLGPYPGGLAPPSPRPLSVEAIDELLSQAGERARAVVERLLWNPVGTVNGADRAVTVDTAHTPVEHLLARRLLRPVGSDTVLLPREVAWHLRGRRFTADTIPSTPPSVPGRRRTPAAVDRAAIGAAYGLVHDVELTAHTLETVPHGLLRDGGVAVRDVAGLARVLGADHAQATFVLETAAAAGLLAVGDGGRLLPTVDYDRWAEREPADRWRALAAAWRHNDQLSGLSSEPGGHALGPESEAPGAASVRGLVVQLLANAAVGTVPDLTDLTAAVRWHRPRLVRVGGVPLTSVLAWTWREAGWLGITSLGAVSALARAAVQADTHPLPASLAKAFPATVDRIVLQADLTAVAPGPVPYRLARDLRLLADQESRGGAAVFRFSGPSLRRAFDAGWSAAEVHRWLAHHATSAIPQPLAYLVDDVARQHGSIRVGPANAYVRIADQAQVAALLAHPDAAVLGLRELAPDVLVATAEPYEVVNFLHQIGHSPAAEDSDGRSVTAPDPLRAPRQAGHRTRRDVQAVETAAAVLVGELAGHERRLRSASQSAANPSTSATVERTPATVGRTSATVERTPATAEALAQLASLQRSGHSVRITYVAADGTPAERELHTIQADAGLVRGTDADSDRPVSIPLSRVSSIQPTTNGAAAHLQLSNSTADDRA